MALSYRYARAWAVSLLAGVVIMGCDDGSAESPENSRPDGGAEVPDASRSDADMAAPAADGEVQNHADAGSRSDAGASLTEAQIFGVISSANATEIVASMMAVMKAKDPSVLAFAEMMVAMHNAAQARQGALAGRLALTAAPSPEQMQLMMITSASLPGLQSAPAKSAAFDVAYIQSQVAAHMIVLQLLEPALASATTPDLKAELVTTRSEVEGHLQMVTALYLAAQAAGAASDAGASQTDAGASN